MTKIDIVSGFLGAGKTTLIKKLLKEALSGEQVVLIENEFGEIGIDGGFLKEAGIVINEMNSGCICCSLVGDFGTALKEVLDKYSPDRILIEPSGVGKLSDVMKAVEGSTGALGVHLNSAVAVVDAKKCKPYLRNFGEFFENQIEHAGTIILSRTGNMTDEKVNACVALIREHNPKATIITTPWDMLEGSKILETIEDAKDLEAELLKEVMEMHDEHEHHHHDHDHHHDDHDHHHDDHDHDHHHDDHDHDKEASEPAGSHDDECTCGCHDHDHKEGIHSDSSDASKPAGSHDTEVVGSHHHHHHDADEVFTSIGIETSTKYTKDKVEECLEELDDTSKYGTILRCKGMLPTEGDRFIHFDYVPGECEVRDGAAEVTGKICVIGSELKEDAIRELFK
jgi:G3E family GTPase